MNGNIGPLDRLIRVILGVALLSAMFVLDGRERWLGLIGLVPLLTAAVSVCPLYTVLGIRTCPAPKGGR
ncbi:MAG: DUF2892 domain-containing protein [Proteobacteria bacterium]|nr:DUF2892 domain-containing protein [Pseudomonadota bacterium]